MLTIRESFDTPTPLIDRLLNNRIKNMQEWLKQNNPPSYIREAVAKEILDCKDRLNLGKRRAAHNNSTDRNEQPPLFRIKLSKIKPDPEFDANETPQFSISMDDWQVEITCKKT